VTTETWQILGILLSGFGLAFISLMETALVSVSPVRLRHLADAGHPTAPIVERLVARPHELLGALVVAINVFVLLAANLTTAWATERWGTTTAAWVNLAVLGLLLVFGEITPKTISVYYAETVALRTARIAQVITQILGPIVTVFTAIGTGLLRVLIALRILRGRTQPSPTAFSEEDIKQLLSAGEQSGTVEAGEREMIDGVIAFADTPVVAIMVPRTDLVALPVETTFEEAVQAFLASGHSRIPVYDDNTDNILGILFIKDLVIRLHSAQASGEPVPAVRDLLRPAHFVPESKKGDDLLREMQRKQVHIAVVVDEYGGTAGIVTIEDLLEEIVGDIIDEYDREQEDVQPQPDGSALVSGRASLDKVTDSFDIPMPEETDAETISGLVTEILGRIPEPGDRVVVSGIAFTVLDVVHNRVERLRAEPA
jgi:putative hemolysin